MTYDLSCRFDSRACFYGKARVQVSESSDVITYRLYSYGTYVATVEIHNDVNEIIYSINGIYSRTTNRHQREFFRQFDLNDDDINQLLSSKNNLTTIVIK